MSVQIPEFLRLNVQNDGVSSESYESCESHIEIELAEMEAAVQDVTRINTRNNSAPEPEPVAQPYLKQDFDGQTLYVSSIMTTPEDVERLIKVLTAFKPLMEHDHAETK